MKKAVKLAICLVLMNICLFAVGCSQSADALPYYQQLCQLLGKPKSEVISALDIHEEDLEYAVGGFYKTPLKAQHSGVSFELWIGIEETQDMLTCFYYHKEYSAKESAQAAKDVVDIAAYIDLFMEQNKGTAFPEELNEAQLNTKTEQQILDILSSTNFYNGHDCWEFQDIADDGIHAAIEKCAALDPISERFTPGFYCTHHFVSSGEAGKIIQTLAFEIDINKGNR